MAQSCCLRKYKETSRICVDFVTPAVIWKAKKRKSSKQAHADRSDIKSAQVELDWNKYYQLSKHAPLIRSSVGFIGKK